MTGDNVATQLIDEDETDRVARIDCETMTEEEKLLSDCADEIVGESKKDDDDIVEFNPIQLEQDWEDTNGDDETEENIDFFCAVVKTRRMDSTKAKVNVLAFNNAFKVGEEEMKKKDFVTSRLMESKRRDRKLAV